ncbi:MAG: hypothetical protein P8Y62_08110 [candidate division WOR-3 bacterium]
MENLNIKMENYRLKFKNELKKEIKNYTNNRNIKNNLDFSMLTKNDCFASFARSKQIVLKKIG